MQGDRREQDEFTIERGREKDHRAGRSSPRGGLNFRRDERPSGQAAFDLGRSDDSQAGGGIPERLRRKYYVAEARVGEEAKVYADPRGEYLAFKVSADRMATRLEDVGLIRDMLSVVQHRGWNEVELRGSEEFRRTAWLEASVRGLAVRGFEPDPVDQAALAFRAKPAMHADKTAQSTRTRDAVASETVSVDGVATRRPINATIMPPERGETAVYARNDDNDAGPTSWQNARQPTAEFTRHTPRSSSARSGMPIELAASKDSLSIRSERDPRHDRAYRFRNGDGRGEARDDIVEAARSQLAAIEKALANAVPDLALRRSVWNYAKERIAVELERGRRFERMDINERTQGRHGHAQNLTKSGRSGRVVDRGNPNLDR